MRIKVVNILAGCVLLTIMRHMAQMSSEIS